jgi:hypothetical protein
MVLGGDRGDRGGSDNRGIPLRPAATPPEEGNKDNNNNNNNNKNNKNNN